MDKNIFNELIVEIIDSIPEKFRDKVENLSVLIDDESIIPSKSSDKKHYNTIILALYQGVPITKRSRSKPVFPDKITIYKKAIESVSRTDEEIKKTTRRVVLHELGHYFGLEEDKLSELGY